MPKKKPLKGDPEVHKDLEGFDIEINEFGEIKTTMKIDKVNDFLDENTQDPKLTNQDDITSEEE